VEKKAFNFKEEKSWKNSRLRGNKTREGSMFPRKNM